MPISRRAFLGSVSIGGLGLATAGATLFRPTEQSGRMPPYFAALDAALKQAELFEPTIVLDLDRLDQNIARAKQQFSDSLSYRLSAKSLPSPMLQHYVMTQMGSHRLMAFHLPYLPIYLAYRPAVDILMGKTVLTGSIEKLFERLATNDRADAAKRIQWLVDTSTRTNELLALAKKMGQKLRINIEIDIGLHRGGAQTTAQLAPILSLIRDNADHLRFSGYMGYDGHVAAAPAPIATIDGSFADAMHRYQTLFDFGQSEFPALFAADDLTFNSGGSKTYQRFGSQPFVNDIAAGSCMVKPSTFANLTDHIPALFIATPVLKENSTLQIPFLDDQSDLLARWNPNIRKSWYVYGGGWAADMVAPEGVSIFKMMADPPNQNLMPNQSLYVGPSTTQLREGDFIFMQPQQGDAMFQFDKIALLRNNKVVGFWDSIDQKF